jgi:AcrR family transcriptional regulator
MAIESAVVAERRTRLSPERERELFAAVLDLVREVGYDALTMDAVAARTRASKATLYRQWRSKPELVATALRHADPVLISDVDTGTLAGDLREMARRLGNAALDDMPLIRALGHAMQQDPDLLQAMRALLVEPELTALRGMLERATRRGELAPDAPATEFVAHMLLGAMAGRSLVEDRDADAAYLVRYVDAVVLPALGLS